MPLDGCVEKSYHFLFSSVSFIQYTHIFTSLEIGLFLFFLHPFFLLLLVYLCCCCYFILFVSMYIFLGVFRFLPSFWLFCILFVYQNMMIISELGFYLPKGYITSHFESNAENEEATTGRRRQIH